MSRGRRPGARWGSVMMTLLLASGLAACGSITGGRERVVGTIDTIGNDSPRAAYVTAEGIVVEVTTLGNGCYTKGETDARLLDGRWVITPYDYRDTRRNIACPDIARMFEHRVVLQGDTEGVDRVWIRARSITDGGTVELEVPVIGAS
ncbi:MAG TPA: hypothetical protein VK929_06760 [Longimicrobiales bacterium]|nr:hypothetical protein [Longimicrobiales bacterium]